MGASSSKPPDTTALGQAFSASRLELRATFAAIHATPPCAVLAWDPATAAVFTALLPSLDADRSGAAAAVAWILANAVDGRMLALAPLSLFQNNGSDGNGDCCAVDGDRERLFGADAPPAVADAAAAARELVAADAAAARAAVGVFSAFDVAAAAAGPTPGDMVLACHAATAHGDGYASEALSRQWASQPSPYLRYAGSPLLRLALAPPDGDDLSLCDALSDLFFHALAPSGLISRPGASYDKRVNPSSGGLHPAEAFVVARGDAAGLWHYAPGVHALELRRAAAADGGYGVVAEAAAAAGMGGSDALPVAVVAVSLLVWREVWKYGPRGWRYSLLDGGHAVFSLAAAASIGGAFHATAALVPPAHPVWDSVFGLGPLPSADNPEGLLPLGLVVLHALADEAPTTIAAALAASAPPGPLRGVAVPVSTAHSPCPLTEAWAALEADASGPPRALTLPGASGLGGSDRALVRGRRSAHSLSGASVSLAAFVGVVGPLAREESPMALVVYASGVEGVAPGVYVVARDGATAAACAAGVGGSVAWDGAGSVDDVPFAMVCVMAGESSDVRAAAEKACCGQALAAAAAFTIGMLAWTGGGVDPLRYRAWHAEAGAAGGALYLGAEAHGLRGTGIGCFLDDTVGLLFPAAAPLSLVFLYFFVVGCGEPHDLAFTPILAPPPPPDPNADLAPVLADLEYERARLARRSRPAARPGASDPLS